MHANTVVSINPFRIECPGSNLAHEFAVFVQNIMSSPEVYRTEEFVPGTGGTYEEIIETGYERHGVEPLCIYFDAPLRAQNLRQIGEMLRVTYNISSLKNLVTARTSRKMERYPFFPDRWAAVMKDLDGFIALLQVAFPPFEIPRSEERCTLISEKWIERTVTTTGHASFRLNDKGHQVLRYYLIAYAYELGYTTEQHFVRNFVHTAIKQIATPPPAGLMSYETLQSELCLPGEQEDLQMILARREKERHGRNLNPPDPYLAVLDAYHEHERRKTRQYSPEAFAYLWYVARYGHTHEKMPEGIFSVLDEEGLIEHYKDSVTVTNYGCSTLITWFQQVLCTLVGVQVPSRTALYETVQPEPLKRSKESGTIIDPNPIPGELTLVHSTRAWPEDPWTKE